MITTITNGRGPEQALVSEIITVKRKQVQFTGYCLAFISTIMLTVIIQACSSKSTTKVLSSVGITPNSQITLTINQAQQFNATGTYSDGSSADITYDVTWTSDSTNIATISSSGLASGVAVGSTKISASLSGKKSPAITLAVIDHTFTTASAFRGSLNGSWSGVMAIAGKFTRENGDFKFVIDAYGDFSGSLGGSKSGTVMGHVDSNGNLLGTAKFMAGAIAADETWQGKVTLSGNLLSFQGTWNGPFGSGTITGNGNISE